MLPLVGKQHCSSSANEAQSSNATTTPYERLVRKYGRERVNQRALNPRLQRPRGSRALPNVKFATYLPPEYHQPQDHPLFVTSDFHYADGRAPPVATGKHELEYKLNQRRLSQSIVAGLNEVKKYTELHDKEIEIETVKQRKYDATKPKAKGVQNANDFVKVS